VYWANVGAGALMRVPVGGGTPSPVAPLTARNAWIALDGASIFWSDGPTGIATQIFKADVDGSSLTPVISNNSGAVNQIAATGAGVFWTMTDGRVIVVPRSGGGPMILASGLNNPTAITVDTTNVYWVTADGTVMKVPIVGGSTTTIATWPPPDPLNPGAPYQPLANVAVDGKNVYWGKMNGPIMEVGLGGGSPTFAFAFGTSRMFASMAVDTQAVYAGDPLGIVHYRRFASPDVEWTVGESGSPVTAIATDPANVYWTVSDPGSLVSRIFKAAR